MLPWLKAIKQILKSQRFAKDKPSSGVIKIQRSDELIAETLEF